MKDPHNVGEFGPGAYIPDGVYFLHYHRLNPGGTKDPYPPYHRLTISDRLGMEELEAEDHDGKIYQRTGLQFHIAWNQFKEWQASISDGCITATTARFYQLFPDSWFDSATSPLKSHGLAGPTLKGAGRVLVFIQHAYKGDRQKAQMAMFQRIIAGDKSGLKVTSFNNAEVGTLRKMWRTVQ